MRTNVSRCLIAVFAATLLSGCSGGRPNLAFWKRSPFQSTPLVTPGKVGDPVRPSAVAANGGVKSPVGSYALATASTTAPTWTPPTTTPVVNVTPGTAYPSPQNPYPTTKPPARPGYNPEYIASTAAAPGARAYTTPQPNPSYDSRGSYGVPAMPPVSPYDGRSVSPPPAGSSYNIAGNSPGSYAPTNTPPESYNPVRPASYPNTQPSAYGGTSGYNGNNPGTARYVAPKAATANPSPYGAGRGTGSDAPKAASRYGDSAYAPPASNPSGYANPAAKPSYGGDSRYNNTTPSNRDSSSGGNVPLTGSRHSSPSATPTTTGSGGYTPPVSSYALPSSGSASGYGYTAPSETSRTTPDANRYSPPSAGSTTPAYRPGSTGNYAPPPTGAGN